MRAPAVRSTYCVGVHRGTARRDRRNDWRPGRAARTGSLLSTLRASAHRRATHSDVSAKSDRYLVELQPPSTTIVWPLMKLPPSEHRNATVLAMSSIVPSRGYGVISVLILRNRSSSRRVATIGVKVTPGATALHRMPAGPYWQAMCDVNAVNPPLAAE